jgi:hypothetical protein
MSFIAAVLDRMNYIPVVLAGSAIIGLAIRLGWIR